ncbi:hypothetical protein GW915_13945 [bacterium]|nr:hypothetical protein [bacterium]
MSLSEMLIKLMGIVLAIVGFALILSTVGLNILGLTLAPWYLALMIGIVFMGVGIYLVRGGNITL